MAQSEHQDEGLCWGKGCVLPFPGIGPPPPPLQLKEPVAILPFSVLVDSLCKRLLAHRKSRASVPLSHLHTRLPRWLH